MGYSIRVEGNTMWLTLSNNIALQEARNLRETIPPFINENINELHIDMSGVDFIDSGGLGTLVKLFKQIQQQGGKMVMTNVKDTVKEILKVTKLTDVFEIR
ncbi:STAS domain-containing protein [Heliobacterium chlorum]|uniref:Anti-sigma factor antagonist n=1 Tax=Heliobacterium chlorum TaxID=2698 RepID=A0ABR7T9N4_HELCL|nr:STAS domain-containing protein [Heliobacterium chlorum]MBC9786456.1 STAS domain-containing protein [Heliobacterium chlorum]